MHDKPINKDLEPSSNNGWIYTAYADLIGEYFIDPYKRDKLLHDCTQGKGENKRLPGLETPPISRDEIIGMYSLYLFTNTAEEFAQVIKNNWYLSTEAKQKAEQHGFNLEHLIRLLTNREDRNYHWERKLYGVWWLTMRLWWHDRHYIQDLLGKPTNPFYWLCFQVYAFLIILQRKFLKTTRSRVSAENVLWLQLVYMDSWFWVRFIDIDKNFAWYFPKDHPLNLSNS